MAKLSYDSLKDQYTELWKTMQVKDSWTDAYNSVAKRILANKDLYLAVEKETGVPWDFIAAAHARESNLDFSTHLHNGDTLNRRTRHVPSGRPKVGTPPFTWQESAIDALKLKGLDQIKDWPIERKLYELERYNGFGYRSGNKPLSPYLWSGTNHYTRGKYIADGKYSSSAVDKQIGTAYLLSKLHSVEKPIQKLDAVSTTFSLMGRIRTGIVGIAAAVCTSIAGLFTLDNFNVAKDWIVSVTNVVGWSNLITLALAAFFIWFITSKVRDMIQAAYVDGRYFPLGEKTEDDVTKLHVPSTELDEK